MAIFDLLDEYEQIQLRIIVTLENMPAPVITTVSELSRLLGASEFVIKKAVQTLAHESMDELSWLFTLTFDRNTITYVRVTNSSPVTSIRYLYSRRSDTVQILESSFEEDFTNVEDFSNKSLMSCTNFFRRRKRLMAYFRKHHLALSERLVLTGDEISVREFYYHYYSVIFCDFEYPFSNTSLKTSTNMIKELAERLDFQLSPTNQLNLIYYTYIGYRRIANGHLVSQDNVGSRMFFSPETLLVDSENVAIAIEILDKTLQGEGIHLSEEELAWEAVSYLNFLLAMNILPISLHKNVALQNHIDPIKELLGKTFATHFSLSYWSIAPMFFKKETTPLDTYLLRLLGYTQPLSEVTTHQRSAYLMENFAEYLDVSKEFFAKFLTQFPDKLTDFETTQENFYNDLLYLLVITIPRTIIEKPLVVALDFSYGYAYTESLKARIVATSNHNIIVTNEFTDKADILLSNITPHDAKNAVHIEWSNPPTRRDWDLFEAAIKALNAQQ